MSAAKEAEARADREEATENEAPLPAYEEFESGGSSSAAAEAVAAAALASRASASVAPASMAPASRGPPVSVAELDGGPVELDAGPVPATSMPGTPLSPNHHSQHVASRSAGPTISSPFDFPSEEDSPPAYPNPTTAFSSNPFTAMAAAEGSQAQAQDQKPHPHGYEWEQQQQMQQEQQQQQQQYQYQQQPQYQGQHQAQRMQPGQRLIAIPQVNLTPGAPLADAYPPSLLAYGITPEAWRSFLSTMSAFLSAKVGDLAIKHAGDMGRTLAENPKRFGKDTADHAKSIGQQIKTQAQDGNIVGAAMNVVGGLITLPVGTAMRIVGATMSLPVTAMRAVTQKPQTPRERSAAYAATANKKWLLRRGLEARIMDSNELAAFVSVDTQTFCETGRLNLDPGTDDTVQRPDSGFLVPLEIGGRPKQLVLGEKTLWLVVVQCAIVPPEDKNKGKGKEDAGVCGRYDRREEKRKERAHERDERERERDMRDFERGREKEEKRRRKEEEKRSK